jgi:hypothetical protein
MLLCRATRSLCLRARLVPQSGHSLVRLLSVHSRKPPDTKPHSSSKRGSVLQHRDTHSAQADAVKRDGATTLTQQHRLRNHIAQLGMQMRGHDVLGPSAKSTTHPGASLGRPEVPYRAGQGGARALQGTPGRAGALQGALGRFFERVPGAPRGHPEGTPGHPGAAFGRPGGRTPEHATAYCREGTTQECTRLTVAQCWLF